MFRSFRCVDQTGERSDGLPFTAISRASCRSTEYPQFVKLLES
jgi:hypothetical protein